MVKNLPAKCPVLFIAAPGSGHGKTLITAALSRHFSAQGMKVSVFKLGPDYLDPTILSAAVHRPVYNLDLWMLGAPQCQQLLYQAACTSDLILIESRMGLFDGTPSSADFAAEYNLPILLVVDAKGMAQSFGAVVKGFTTYQESLIFAGIVANNVGSKNHHDLIKNSLPKSIPLWGSLPRSADIAIPHRHLGLVQAPQIVDLEQRFLTAVNAVEHHLKITLPPATVFTNTSDDSSNDPGLRLDGITIGIAKDAAFSFIYPANIDQLVSLGAQLKYFSPLTDTQLPGVDCLWLPGGYPESYVKTLSANEPIKHAIRAHFNADKPILAECGGMLYACNSLCDINGHPYPMLGLLNAQCEMQSRCVSIGMQSVPFPEGILRGHTFHHSKISTDLTPISYGVKHNHQSPGEAVYRVNRLTASYTHSYFPSNANAIAALFSACDDD